MSVKKKVVKKKAAKKRKSAPMELTAQMKLFCYEYVIDCVGSKAAERAGYSAGRAKSSASRLLKKPKVKELVNRLMKQKQASLGVDAEWVLKEQVDIYKRCAQAKPVLDRSGKPIMVETPNGDVAPAYAFDSSGANKALENIGKHIKVNAFKATDSNDVPIDQNWVVTVVDGSGKPVDP